MEIALNQLYHIYNRGNKQEKIFFKEDHYHYFLWKLRNEIAPHCSILAWCLMPNHYHLLVYPGEAALSGLTNRVGRTTSNLQPHPHPLVRKIGTLQSSYTRGINQEMGTTGSLFQQKAKAKCIDELDAGDEAPASGQNTSGAPTTKRQPSATVQDYALTCFHYIHQNPLEAGLVEKMEDWPFSSFKDYVGLRNGTLCDKKLAADLLELPSEPSELYRMSYEAIEEQKIAKLF